MPSHRFRTALLVAPQPMLRRTLRTVLLAAGVKRVVEAATGAEALACLGSELVQLVLTPWELEDMQGRPLLEALSRHGRNRDVPVVLLDEGLPRASVIAAVKAGAAGRLPLPADPRSVRALLERIAAERPAPPGMGRAPGDPARGNPQPARES